jgi:hypothetical protein
MLCGFSAVLAMLHQLKTVLEFLLILLSVMRNLRTLLAFEFDGVIL